MKVNQSEDGKATRKTSLDTVDSTSEAHFENQMQTDYESEFKDEEQSDQHKEIIVSLEMSPKPIDFKIFFKELVSHYEQTAGKIQTLLHEPQFRLFYQTPIYELTTIEKETREKMNINDIEMPGDAINLRPWPEVEFLFGEDENYQYIVSDLMKNITESLNEANEYSMKFNKYCEMVESSLILNISNETIKKGISLQMIIIFC